MKKILVKIKNYKPPKFLFILLFFLVICCVFLNNKVLDNDIWFLLSHGKYVINHGIPNIEPFSMYENFSFIMQQWLSATIFYSIYYLFGKLGLRIFITFIYTLIIFLLYKITLLISNNKFYLASLITFLISICLIPFIVSRPQIFTYLILLLAIYLFELYIKYKKIKYLYFLPLLSLLLINLHASMWFMLFLFLLPYYLSSFNFKIKFIKGEGYFNKHLIIVLVLMFISGFINPYGIKAITYLFTSYNIKEINDYILEMQPVLITTMNGKSHYFLILSVITIYIIYKKGDLKLRYFLLLIGTIYLGIVHYKSYALFLLGGLVPLAYYLNPLFKEYQVKKRSCKYILSCSIVSLSMITLLIFTYLKTTPKDEYNYDTINQQSIEYLEKNYSKDIKLYVNYMDGSYAMFKGFKVYIDPRAEVYLKSNNQQEDIFLEYYNLQHGLIKVEDFLTKYNFDILLLNEKDKIYNYLNEFASNYEEVYNDNKRFIYQRKDYIKE